MGSTFANNNHPELDYGPSNQSAPHIFVANGLVVVPYDINLSAIAFWRSGAAFNPRGIIDSDGDGLVDQRDLTQPRNSFRAVKRTADIDLRAEKKVPFGRHTASVLVEAFNLFNRDNVANVNAVSGPTFGTPIFVSRRTRSAVRHSLLLRAIATAIDGGSRRRSRRRRTNVFCVFRVFSVVFPYDLIRSGPR